MATRLYFPSSGSAAAQPAFSAEWTHSATAVRRPALWAKSGTALAAQAAAPDAADHLVDGSVLIAQFVSPPLLEQVLPAQTVSWQLQGLEADAANNLFLALKLFTIDRAAAVVSTLIAQRRDSVEFLTTRSSRGDSAAIAQTFVALGHRLIVEVGLGGLPTATTGVQGHNGTLYLGDPLGSADIADDADVAATSAPWLQFPSDVRFLRDLPRFAATQGVKTQDGVSSDASWEGF